MRLGAYDRLLRAPHVAALIASAVVARLPQGFGGLALLLLVRQETGSYAQAGATLAAMFAAVGVSAPILGRLVDRLGQTRVLVPVGIAEGLGYGAIALAGAAGAPGWAFIVLAAPLGLANPPVAASLRALWSDALPEGIAPETAFSLESTAQELIFIVGPLLAAAMLAVTGPAAVLGAAAAISATGTLAFASLPPSRAWRSKGAAGRGRGALANVGVRTLVVVSALLVATFSMVEVVVVAFSTDRGAPEAAGVLLAIWAAASLAGGLWHGSRRWRGEVRRRLVLFALIFPLGFLPLVAAWSTWSIAPLIISAGFLIAPVLACAYILLGRLAPQGTVTEAFSWQGSAFVIGAGAGAALGGVIVEQAGTRAAFAAIVGVAALCPALLLLRRRSLVAPSAELC